MGGAPAAIVTLGLEAGLLCATNAPLVNKPLNVYCVDPQTEKYPRITAGSVVN